MWWLMTWVVDGAVVDVAVNDVAVNVDDVVVVNVEAVAVGGRRGGGRRAVDVAVTAKPPGLARAWAFTRGFDDDDGGGKDGDGGERSDGGKTDVMWQRVNRHSSLPDLGITNYKLIIYLNIVNNTNNPFRTDSVPVIPVCIPGICRFR